MVKQKINELAKLRGEKIARVDIELMCELKISDAQLNHIRNGYYKPIKCFPQTIELHSRMIKYLDEQINKLK